MRIVVRLVRRAVRKGRFHVALATLAVLVAFPTPGHAATCAVPISGGESPRSNDCLFILRAAVGTRDCELCVCDADGSASIVASDAHLCLRTAVGLATSLDCPPCVTTTTDFEDTTTTTLATPTTTTTLATPTTTTTFAPTTTTTFPPNENCPGSVEWTTYGSYGALCETNAECQAGECDEASGHCRTKSHVDVGWTGLGHDDDPGDGAVLRAIVACEASEAPCGQCEILGVDADSGNCRCANDNHARCDEPFEADADDCRSCAGGEKNGKPCDAPEDCPGGACSGAAVCQCFGGPPIPLNAGGTPICLLPRLATNPQGVVDVDSGESEVALSMRMNVTLGISTRAPCPICGGRCSNAPTTFCVRDYDCPGGACNDDTTPNDGLREGVCTFGADYEINAGQACDKSAFHASFPAYVSGPNGGWTSLDCIPDIGRNVSGPGLVINLTETTGTVALESKVPCPAPYSSQNCPCLVCSTDPTVACNADEDCASVMSRCQLGTGVNAATCSTNGDCASASGGNCNQNTKRCISASSIVCATNVDCTNLDLGDCPKPTCSGRGFGEHPQPNQCNDLDCADAGNGTGSCTTGPDASYCSEVVKADGSGVLSCASNADCVPGVVGVVAGSCTLVERCGCFLDPIEASGDPDAHQPLLAAAFCVPPSSNTGINSALGLPGPVRALKQTTLRSYCDAHPLELYVPGSGGCAP